VPEHLQNNVFKKVETNFDEHGLIEVINDFG